jgi:hypothetical protein
MVVILCLPARFRAAWRARTRVGSKECNRRTILVCANALELRRLACDPLSKPTTCRAGAGRFSDTWICFFLNRVLGSSAATAAESAEHTIVLAERADEARAAIVVFPELRLSGYSNEDLFHQDALLDTTQTALDREVS